MGTKWIHDFQWVPAGTHWKVWIHFCSFICLTWIHTIQWVPAGTHWKLWIHFCSFIWLTWIHTIQWVPAGTHWKVWIHFATEKDRQKLDIFCFKFRKKNIQNLSNFYLNPAVHKIWIHTSQWVPALGIRNFFVNVHPPHYSWRLLLILKMYKKNNNCFTSLF